MINKNKKKPIKKRDSEDLEKLMVDAMNKLFCRMPYLNEMLRSKPFTLGFAIKFGSKGKASMRVRVHAKKRRRNKYKRAKGLVDIIHYDDSVLITAFLPGFREKDIDVKINPQAVVISSANEKAKFYKEIPLNVRVVPESAKKSFKNGVLEVAIKKANSI